MQESVAGHNDPIALTPFRLEPDLLPVMQMLFTLQFVLQSAGLIFAYVQLGFIPTLAIPHLITLALLLIYVYWPGLPQKLGRAFLPIVVVYYSIISIIQRYLFLGWALPDLARQVEASPGQRDFIMDNGWSLLVSLLIPLALVAWQYDLKAVIWYCVGITLVELPLMTLAPRPPHITLLDMTSIIVMRAVVFAMVGYIITRMIGAQRAQRRALAEANARLQRAAATQEQLIVSRERNRLAHELHDTLAHSLSAVAVQLEAADSALDESPVTARSLLAKALAQTRSGLTETRRALQALRASPLEDMGLPLAIRTLAESTARRTGMALEMDLPATPTPLAPAMEQGVYRVAQEALNNAARHSAATQLRVALHSNGQSGAALRLTISDNGRGFDPAVVDLADHYGLQGMVERAEMMNGALEIHSAPNAGTAITLSVAQETS